MRQNQGRIKGWAAALAFAVSSLLAANTALAQDIVVAIGAEPGTLDPQVADDGAERTINDNIFETLLVRDPQGVLQPSLAAQLPTQIDALTWQIDITDGLTFTNGEALDAAAVAYSINRILDPELATEQGSYVSTLASAEAIDDLTVQIVTNEPDPTLAARLSWIKIVPPEYSQDPAFASVPIGSGPYLFSEWKRGEDVTIVANPDYWGGAPDVEKVTFRFISDANTRVAGLLSGELDLVTNVAPDVLLHLPQYATTQGVELSYMLLNARDGAGVTADRRVRQALNYAVNKEELSEALFGGAAAVLDGQLLPPTAFGYDPTIDPYPYDPERARELLREAGAEGASITVTAQNGRWLKDGDMAEAIAGYWSAIGLDVKVDIHEWSEFLNRIRNRETRPQANYGSSSNELFDADRPIMQMFHPTLGSSSSNSDTALGEMIEQARYEMDPEARLARYSEILHHIRDEAYMVFLLWNPDYYGLSERIEWTPRPDGKILIKDFSVAE